MTLLSTDYDCNFFSVLTEMKVETQEDAAADNDLQIEDLCLSYTLKNSPFSQPTVSALATPAVLSKQVDSCYLHKEVACLWYHGMLWYQTG